MRWIGANMLWSTHAAAVVVEVATIPEHRSPLMFAISLGLSRATSSTTLEISSQSLKEVSGNVDYLESRTRD